MRGWLLAALATPVLLTPHAGADPAPGGPPGIPFGGNPGIGPAPGLGAPGPPGLTPAAATLFLCPGRGAAASVLLGVGGGYCDFDFTPVQLSPTTFGVMHVHCEWGGAGPIVEMFNCWRVFPGQPDHPAHPDPDIVPDGYGVPWAINGPSPADQWPPPGLAPAPPPEPPAPEPAPP